jgi:alpha-tubulin suppressor-like RCC1 family protein
VVSPHTIPFTPTCDPLRHYLQSPFPVPAIALVGYDNSGIMNIPERVDASNCTDVCAGYYHSCALCGEDGEVTCWGTTDTGIVGVPTAAQQGVRQISCGNW